MADITPAILEKNFSEIKNKLTFLRERTKCAQIDFCDGIFVPQQTWPFATGGFDDPDFIDIINEKEGLPFWEEIDFEFDLMVADAVDNFNIYMKLGPKRMIFHLEAVPDFENFKDFLEGIDMYTRDIVQIGVAINPSSAQERIFSLIPYIDFVQCMGIEKIGFQGQELDEKVFENIKQLKKKFPGIIISVDGGVNIKNAPMLIASGADRLTVGSGIWKNPDPIGTLQTFQSLL
jgi:ribulose-phosphate 3-epimerase